MTSVRAEATTFRTYARPTNTGLETWEEICTRVIKHTETLWYTYAQNSPVDSKELEELKQLMLERKIFPAGRTLWLGGTNIAYSKAASQFNCSFTYAATASDIKDIFWLLLQGCGVGFLPRVGSLSGFAHPLPIKITPSLKTAKEKGDPLTQTSVSTITNEFTLKIGDSAEGWAKSIYILLTVPKEKFSGIHLDFSEIRGAGDRLEGYGWICNGYAPLKEAYVKICNILNKRAGALLTEIDILDIVNLLGDTLSSRRAAELAALEYNNPRSEEFAKIKKDCYKYPDRKHRQLSNNSLLFDEKPTREHLVKIFDWMAQAGGSEPGFLNRQAGRSRAPWMVGVNPCAEILLPSGGFCNLVEVDLGKFKDDLYGAKRALYLAARMNYRQTLVNLKDGVLSDRWHDTNETLRLCGVSVTGIVRTNFTDYEIRRLRDAAVHGAYSMADELGLNRPALVTTIKPSGTLSKIADTTEGIHKPLGKYIFNWIQYSVHDPIVNLLRKAGYKVKSKDEHTVVVCFPVKFDDVVFDVVDGKEANNESAIAQLERYKKWMKNWCDHNCSITVNYKPEEVPAIIDWLLDNWEYYVGVSFIYKHDPTLTAEDLGVAYLPQEVVTEETYNEYVKEIQRPDFSSLTSIEDIIEDECASGSCPVR